MLTIEQVSKRFGETVALDSVSLNVADGETVALLGPSGCGKSTLLNVVAGLVMADGGRVLWDGEDLSHTAPHARGFGLMFQDYLLFPHLNVAQNVAFGLKMAGWEKARRDERVDAVLRLVGLQGYETREVGGLSGGEQQRAALARALAPEPKVLMLDEPLGALDRALRERLAEALKAILDETGQTALYVTHDQEEAYAVGDRIAVMNAGRIEQVGAPQAVYREPANAFVARFLGMSNVLDAQIVDRDGAVVAETAVGDLPVTTAQRGAATVLIRPDGATLGDGALTLRGTVTGTMFRGRSVQLDVNVDGVALRFELGSDAAVPAVGDAVALGLAARAVQVV